MIEELKRKAMAEREARAEDKFTTAWHDAASPDIVLRLVAAVELLGKAENELAEVVEWASIENAPLRPQEINSICTVRDALRAALADLEGKQ